MPAYRSRTTTHGRNMAGARGLWRATGMKDDDFGKPIIAVVNSFTQFVPGHVHLKDLGQLVAREIEKAGGVAKEFNTIAVDDGIAMGHDGMLYSLPSREIIADSVEYMVNAHCADALVCISNCDKITPGMLMAALRLNIPVGVRLRRPDGSRQGRHSTARSSRVDLVDAMVAAADDSVTDEDVEAHRALRLPDLRLVLRHVHRQLDELPDRGARPGAARQRLDARHPRRPQAASSSRPAISSSISRAAITSRTTPRVLPRSIATFNAFENAMTLDIAMGGSTNTVLHLLAAAHEGERRFHHARHRPAVAPRAGAVQGRAGQCRRAHGRRAPRRRHHGDPRRARPRRPDRRRPADGAQRRRWATRSSAGTSSAPTARSVRSFYRAAPGGVPTTVAFSQDRRYEELDADRARQACIRDAEHAFSKDGGLAVLYGNLARGRLHREDGRRRRQHPDLLRSRRASSRARTQRWTASWAARSSRATWC